MFESFVSFLMQAFGCFIALYLVGATCFVMVAPFFKKFH